MVRKTQDACPFLRQGKPKARRYMQLGAVPQALRLGGGFVGDGLAGKEIGGEALGVGGEELLDAFRGGGF